MHKQYRCAQVRTGIAYLLKEMLMSCESLVSFIGKKLHILVTKLSIVISSY